MVDRPVFRTGITAGRVVTAAPVRSLSAVDMARLHNWLMGYGAQVVPECSPNIELVKSSELVFRFRTRPRYQALERRWFIRARAAVPTTLGAMSVEIPSGATAVTRAIVSPRSTTETHEFVESLSSQSETEGELTVAITADESGLILESISCWEVPRVSLVEATSGDRGVEAARLASGAKIQRNRLESIFLATEDPALVARRASLFQYALPATVGGATSTAHVLAITSTSYVGVFGASGIPVLLRKDLRGDLSANITGKVYAWVSGGTGNVRISSSKFGASTAATISTTTPAWSSAITAEFDSEDLDASDGIQTDAAAGPDYLQIEARKNTSGTLYLASASGWEA